MDSTSSEEYFRSLDPKARFQPTDQELVKHFLKRRVSGDPLPMNVIIDEQLFYLYSPAQLPHMYGFANQEEMYFFTPLDGQEWKSCNGFWEPISTYELIQEGNKTIGFKKLLRFFAGSRKKDATPTNWTMVRYASECFGTVEGSCIFLCKVYEQKTNTKNIPDLKLNTPGKSAADVTRDQQLLGSESYITRPVQELYQREKRRCLSKNSSQLTPAISCTSSYLNPCLPQLPFEIIIEILSWLPVKCLLRFMCVCKNWCLLIEDYKFVSKHMDRVSLVRMYYTYRWEIDGLAAMYDANFRAISAFCGLVLEKSLDSRVFRIRNAARRQVLFLPYAHEGTSTMDFAFNSFTGDCKVACFYCKTEGMGNSISHEVGFKVISIGKDEQWRALKLPNQNDKWVLRQGGKYVLKRHSFGPDKVDGFAHLVEIIRDGQDLYLEIQSLDVWSECFITSTLPRGVFTDLEKVSVIRWYHYIAVADITDAVLNVLLLEDPRDHRWSKKKISVPLDFLKDDPALEAKIIPNIAGKDTVVLYGFNNGRVTTVFSYNMRSQIHHKSSSISQAKCYTAFKPSLVTLKGMKLKRIVAKMEGESNQ